MKKFSKLVALGLSLTVGAALAGPADNSVVIGASQEPRLIGGDFLSVISSQSIKVEVEKFLFAPLYATNTESDLVPVLATEVPTVANRRIRVTEVRPGVRRAEIDVTLKEGLKWSDGNNLTTDDVAFYFEVAKTPGMPLPNPDFFDRANVRVRDARNFTLVLEPAFYYDTTVTIGDSGFMAPSHIMRQAWNQVAAQARTLDPKTNAQRLTEIFTGFFQQFGSNQAINAGRMVYSGPFRVTRWVSNNTIDMARNANFTAIVPAGGAANYAQRVQYRIIQNTNSLLVAILGGSIDATSTVALTLDQALSPQLRSRAPGRFNIYAVAGPIWEHIDIAKFPNVERTRQLTLDDPRTRQALLLALNRDAWVQSFFQGAEPVAHSFVAPSNPLFSDAATKYPYNPERARQLLAAVGWRPGSDGILTRNGVRFELELTTTAGNSIRERTQQLFIEQWRQVGIAVKVSNAPSAVVFDSAFINRGSEGKWQMFMFAWVNSLAERGQLFQSRDLNTNTDNIPTAANNFAGQNIGFWKNDEFDRVTSQAAVEFDPERRKQLMARAQAIWAEELPALPLRYRSNPLVIRTGLVNYVNATYSGGNGYIGWNAWEIGWASRGARASIDYSKVSAAREIK
ncbi:MAG: peptide ABC transporter substrate-binding protein [Meiothermus sp.]|nr:peptide ABC transporter substrate-binding protein [Meiothermus sp.]